MGNSPDNVIPSPFHKGMYQGRVTIWQPTSEHGDEAGQSVYMDSIENGNPEVCLEQTEFLQRGHITFKLQSGEWHVVPNFSIFPGQPGYEKMMTEVLQQYRAAVAPREVPPEFDAILHRLAQEGAKIARLLEQKLGELGLEIEVGPDTDWSPPDPKTYLQ